MSNKVDDLKAWFAKLSEAEKKEVLKFLYGKALQTKQLTEGVYCGPAPELATRGLFCGPAPTSQDTSRCSACGRAF